MNLRKFLRVNLIDFGAIFFGFDSRLNSVDPVQIYLRPWYLCIIATAYLFNPNHHMAIT